MGVGGCLGRGTEGVVNAPGIQSFSFWEKGSALEPDGGDGCIKCKCTELYTLKWLKW